jgi:anti-anti-sigma factor
MERPDGTDETHETPDARAGRQDPGGAPASDPDEPTAVWRVTLAGPIDLAAAPTVERTLLDAIDDGGRYLLVDVGDVEFMDSTGLRAILTARAEAEQRGGSLVLERCTPAVEQLLELSALLTGLTSRPGRS